MFGKQQFLCLFIAFYFFFTTVARFSPPEYSKCTSKDFGYGSTVCVCSDELSCDSFSEGKPLSEQEYAVYTSSKAGDRFSLKTGKIRPESPESERHRSAGIEIPVFFVNQDEVFQTILGIGGAFTDAAGINILKLSSTLQKDLLSSYFSPDGIEYSLGRIPIASCDFSTWPYSYDDHEGDFSLADFSLVKEDFQLKIPLLVSAAKMSKRKVKFFGSPWSAPAWMKTNGKMHGKGTLKGKAGDKYHKAWALYFVKFLEAYEKNGVKIWGLTVQNEPLDGFMSGFPFQCMGYTAEMERDFIGEDLGPALKKFNYSDVKLMMFDENRRFNVEKWADTILGDKVAAPYVSGVALHWYSENETTSEVLTNVHKKYPNHFILHTEACSGYIGPPAERRPQPGNWSRGSDYAYSIIENLSHWSTGWVDWNIALNMNGGPNWVNNFVDSPIIVDAENGVFYKQPMFYHLGHFSKFVPPGSQRIDVSCLDDTSLVFIGFVTPQGDKVLVILNPEARDFNIRIKDNKSGIIDDIIPPFAIQTYIW